MLGSPPLGRGISGPTCKWKLCMWRAPLPRFHETAVCWGYIRTEDSGGGRPWAKRGCKRHRCPSHRWPHLRPQRQHPDPLSNPHKAPIATCDVIVWHVAIDHSLDSHSLLLGSLPLMIAGIHTFAACLNILLMSFLLTPSILAFFYLWKKRVL